MLTDRIIEIIEIIEVVKLKLFVLFTGDKMSEMEVKVTNGIVVLNKPLWDTLQRHSGYCREHVQNLSQLPRNRQAKRNCIDLSVFFVDRRLLFALLGRGRVPDSYDLLTLVHIASMLQISVGYLCFLFRYQYHENNIVQGKYIPALYFMIHKDSQMIGAVPYILSIFNMEGEMVEKLKQFITYRTFRLAFRNMLSSNRRFEAMLYSQPCKYTRIMTKCKCTRCVKAWHKYNFERIQAEIEESRTGCRLTKMVKQDVHLVCPECFPENAAHILFSVQERHLPECTKPLRSFLDCS